MAFIKAVMPEAAETEGIEDFLEAVANKSMLVTVEKKKEKNPAKIFSDTILNMLEMFSFSKD